MKAVDQSRFPLRIVGHRGASRQSRENTLPALEQAARCGAHGVELDVQYTRLGEPLVFHDADLWRMAGRPERIRDLCSTEIRDLVAAEAPRHPKYRDESTHVPDLVEAVETLSHYDIEVFVEIKDDGLNAGNIEDWVAATVDACRPLKDRSTIISFSQPVLRAARLAEAPRIGWILKRWSDQNRGIAAQLQPNLLIASKRILPRSPAPLWPGRWQWMVYEVNDARRARLLHARGADYVETNDPVSLLRELEHPERP